MRDAPAFFSRKNGIGFGIIILTSGKIPDRVLVPWRDLSF